MSNISSEFPMSLEKLPNEILTEIVSLIDYTERFKIFGTLNKRFDSIIKFLGVAINGENAKEEIPSDFISDYYSSLICYHLDDQISWIDLGKCTRLRSLTLTNANLSQLASIRSHNLPNLVHLRIETKFEASEEAKNLVIELSANQFSHLKSIKLPQFNFVPQVQCAQIQSVEINTTQMEHFSLLLQLLSNLICLKTKLRLYSSNSAMTPNLGSVVHPKLRHLSLKIDHSLYAFEIEWLLKCTPELRHLEIGSFNHIDGRIVNFDRLLGLFNTYTLKLREYKPHYPIADPSSIDSNDFNRVRSISPLFANIHLSKTWHYGDYIDVHDGGDGNYRKSYIIKV